MLTVHALAQSRAYRVLWLLEELGLDYEVISYRRDPRTSAAPPELRAVHPLGKSPVLTDGDLTVAESGAILEYLLERYGAGRLRPLAGSPEHTRYLFWMHHAEGSGMPQLQSKYLFQLLPGLTPALIRPIARMISKGVLRARIDPELTRTAAFWEAHLAEFPWFAGSDFSAADIQMSYAVEALLSRRAPGESYPALEGFQDRIRDRPAYRAAAARAGMGNSTSPVPKLG